MTTLDERTRELLGEAQQAYGRTEHETYVSELRKRFDAPLRVAIAGKVKAGKSTLLNALVGARVAPTDAAESTRIITWYQDGLGYDVRIHPRDGPPRPAPYSTTDGAMRVDLGGQSADQIECLVVTWPSQELRAKTLIDSPGIGSLSREVSDRTVEFLSPDDVGTPADAVIYLMRHLHGQDVELLRSFHDEDVARPNPINAVAVLSRADEIGSGRLDAMVSARRVADRMSHDPAIRRLVQAFVPVAGLLAETAATLTECEFQELRELASRPEADLDRLLVSADHFTSDGPELPLTASQRRHLLDRFAIFGVRVATHSLRSGRVTTAGGLAAELLTISGVGDLRRLLETLFMERRQVLKSRSALLALRSLLDSSPSPSGASLSRKLEQLLASDHSIEELGTLGAIRGGWVQAKPDVLEEMERLLGASGQSAHARLGLPIDVMTSVLRSVALQTLAQWQRRAESPLSLGDLAAASRVVMRSIEGLIADLERTA